MYLNFKRKIRKKKFLEKYPNWNIIQKQKKLIKDRMKKRKGKPLKAPTKTKKRRKLYPKNKKEKQKNEYPIPLKSHKSKLFSNKLLDGLWATNTSLNSISFLYYNKNNEVNNNA